MVQQGSVQQIADQYQRYWDAASRNFPCIVVGMGRWGKVLAGVLGAARGSGSGIHLLARSNSPQIEDWAASRLAGARVHASFDEMLTGDMIPSLAQHGFAIVASDPARHRADWLRLRDVGIPVLIEKPLAIDLADVDALAASAGQKPITGVGIEFALMPVWKYVRSQFEAHLDEIRLTWDDPADEVRHGAAKRRHDGVSLAADLSYHVGSILNHFCSIGTLKVASVRVNTPSDAHFDLESREVPRIAVDLSAAASRRRREIMLRAGPVRWTVDFSRPVPSLDLDGERVPMPRALAGFDSTLRLEIGAFHLRTRDEEVDAPITEWLAPCAEFHKLLLAATREAVQVPWK